jgi:hypothetical protein
VSVCLCVIVPHKLTTLICVHCLPQTLPRFDSDDDGDTRKDHTITDEDDGRNGRSTTTTTNTDGDDGDRCSHKEESRHGVVHCGKSRLLPTDILRRGGRGGPHAGKMSAAGSMMYSASVSKATTRPLSAANRGIPSAFSASSAARTTAAKATNGN